MPFASSTSTPTRPVHASAIVAVIPRIAVAAHASRRNAKRPKVASPFASTALALGHVVPATSSRASPQALRTAITNTPTRASSLGRPAENPHGTSPKPAVMGWSVSLALRACSAARAHRHPRPGATSPRIALGSAPPSRIVSSIRIPRLEPIVPRGLATERVKSAPPPPSHARSTTIAVPTRDSSATTTFVSSRTLRARMRAARLVRAAPYRGRRRAAAVRRPPCPAVRVSSATLTRSSVYRAPRAPVSPSTGEDAARRPAVACSPRIAARRHIPQCHCPALRSIELASWDPAGCCQRRCSRSANRAASSPLRPC